VAISRADALLLGVAVVAVSTSAPLTREAAAPALAVAFWRNAFASAGLVPVAAARQRRGRAAGRQRRSAVGGRTWALAGGAGIVLGAHFAAWIASLSLTTVASSVALVSTQPVWAALMARAGGERVARRVWAGIALALVGVAIATGVDVGGSARAVRGDLLALAGGVLAAAYVTMGAAARRRLTTIDYTAVCYAVAGVAVLVAAIAAGQRLTGFDAKTWWCLVAITVGPQLLGHSVFNRVLRTVGPTVVSVAVLGEIVGASLLAAWWFGERPPAGIVPAAACIVAGVVLVVRGRAPAGVGPAAEVVAG
jgi:drug/metabolite transporter (DMT)-like permease